MDLIGGLNDKQREAVLSEAKQLLILAGAGSGKTKTVTHKIAYLLKEKNVDYRNILAITFTNKAAAEMKERISLLLDGEISNLWVATFHSSCVRILRRFIDRLGYNNDFTIYDTIDQRAVITAIIKKLDLDAKNFTAKGVLSDILKAKIQEISYKDYEDYITGYRGKTIAEIYKQYEEALKEANALDFEDLLIKTVKLLEEHEDVRDYYSNRFEYIFVDEYQDTNMIQFKLIELLARNHKNLCVVGDDDQSIYRFRGADIQNILGFEKLYPDAQVIKLEQNYRSTKNILDAANKVIANNKFRKDKKLWSALGNGEEVQIRSFNKDWDEADFVVRKIEEYVNLGKYSYKDFAVLYRVNSQSRLIEEKLVRNNVSYKIFGGINFYQRKEIKDMLAYLKLVLNPDDMVSFRRIVNVPKRGIGDASINKVEEYAIDMGISVFSAARECENISGIGAAARRSIIEFTELIWTLHNEVISGEIKLDILFDTLYTDSGYEMSINTIDDYEEKVERQSNIAEFRNKVVDYSTEFPDKTLSEFLIEISLLSDIDANSEDDDYVKLMTVHTSKGLEFPCVFIIGFEENILPSFMSIEEGPEGVEEERRLCYVAITRAMKELFVTYACERRNNGRPTRNKKSRFLVEMMGEEKIKEKGEQETSNFRFRVKSNTMKYNKKAALNRDEFKMPDIKDVDIDFGNGDKVKHKKFGEGIVKGIEESNDTKWVIVDFEKSGVKRMAAALAKLVKID